MSTRKSKIFDCFCFFNELELLELRLMELSDIVDFFVIAEANKTFVGNNKEFIFEKNKRKFKKYLNKIIYVKVTDLPSPTPENVWIAEHFQRNAISRGLEKAAAKGDKILLSDVDEIPNTKAIRENLTNPNRIVFKQSLYYYYVNCKVNRDWGGTTMATYGTFPSPQRLRNSTHRHSFGVYPNGGWHYSYLTGDCPERVTYKTKNLVHFLEGYNFVTDDYAAQRIKNFKDLYGRQRRTYQMQIVDISHDKPKSMDEFLKKYPQFFYK